jgi:peptide/nickel transport system substrate-binding protein
VRRSLDTDTRGEGDVTMEWDDKQEHETSLGSSRFTREQIVRRGTAGGLLLGSGTIASILAGCMADDEEASDTTTNAQDGNPKRGGRLRHGSTVSFGAESLDAHKLFGFVNDSRIDNLYDNLVLWNREHSVLEPHLAEEFTAETADTWLIRLKPDITFHNGKPLTADDVIYTMQRIIDPKVAAVSATTLASVDPNGFTKMDNLTVRLKLKRPDVTIAEAMAEFSAGIVPVDYDPTQPVGTGPFVYESYTPGVRSLFSRNPNYWQEGKPYFDELEIVEFEDESARVNALLSGQVDVIDHVPLGQISVVEARDDLRILDNPGGGQWLPFTMRVDQAPFDNNDVRMAMRLIVDRQQMVDQALAGYGRIGNDIFSPVDPCYNDTLEQREQDLDQARSLLRAAGHENLTVELVAANPAAGMLEAAQVLAEQARGAGVTINVRNVDVPTLFGDNYPNWRFAMTFWATRNFLLQAAQNMLPTSGENNTHWPDPESSRYPALYTEALGTLDEDRRCEIIHEMQQMEWERGGHIVWGFSNFVDAHHTKVKGLLPTKGQMPLNGFNFEEIWFE